MAVLLVSYDLKQPGRDYSRIIAFLQSFPRWAKPLESVYFLETDKTTIEVERELQAHVDGNDRILVIKIDPSVDGVGFNLPTSVFAWLGWKMLA